MIDYTKLDIRQVTKDSYFVFDELNDQMILEILRTYGSTLTGAPAEKKAATIKIWDVRGESKVLVKTVPVRNWNQSHLTEIVLNVIEGLTCEVCHQEWGPVCDGCADEAADKTFLLLKQLERMVDE